MISKLIFSCILIFVFAAICFAQTETPCKLSKDLGGKYKYVSGESGVVEGKKIFFLNIKLSHEKLNEKYLREVARRIKETFCSEKIIYTEIWDKSEIRNYDDLTPPPIFPPWTRALYNLDRLNGKETLNFIVNDKVTGDIKLD